MTKSIQTLIKHFQVDLRKLPNDNCVQDKAFDEIENTTKFILHLEELEFDIFNRLIFYVNRDGKSTYEFNSSPISLLDIDKIEKVTNSLYEILKDGTVAGTGRFKTSDKETILKYEFWEGRIWVDSVTFSTVLLDVKDNVLRLSILPSN